MSDMLQQDDPAGWPTFVFHPTEEMQNCPRCDEPGPFSPRHSPYICLACSENIVNEDGKHVVFVDMGECRLRDADPSDPASWRHYSGSDRFFIDDRPVTVYDGRFGGFVVRYPDSG